MSLCIRDRAVDDLAKKAQKITKAANETEAVPWALENELAHAKEGISLIERIGKIQGKVTKQLGPNPRPFDMKAFSDELWEA